MGPRPVSIAAGGPHYSPGRSTSAPPSSRSGAPARSYEQFNTSRQVPTAASDFSAQAWQRPVMARTSRSPAFGPAPHSEQCGSKLRALAFQSSQDMISRNLASATLISVCGLQRHSPHHANTALRQQQQHVGNHAAPDWAASCEDTAHALPQTPRAFKQTWPTGEAYWKAYWESLLGKLTGKAYWGSLLGGTTHAGRRAGGDGELVRWTRAPN
jgi:hypothetical protein